MSRVSETVTVDCDIKHETSKALLISSPNGEGDIVDSWIPLSQVQKILRKESISAGLFTAQVTMSKWIAGEKGLVY